jgi:hypothetical protein
MATNYLEDYTKYRANQWAATWSGTPPKSEDGTSSYKIGRSDYIKVKTIVDFAVEPGGTVSGTEGTILV